MEYKKQLYRKCPVCKCARGEVLYTVMMNLPKEYGLSESYDVVCCKNCGFTFADTKTQQENYKHYYEKCNLYSDVGRVKKGLYEETHRKDFERIQKYCRKESHILDIGCGNGGILKLLLEHGYKNLYGMDPSPQSIQYLLSIGLEGAEGDIYSEVPKHLKHKFDFVICTAVFEHLLFLEPSINRIKDYLNAKGKLYVTVPGIEGFSKYKNLVADYFNHEHINYFNKYALDYLMKRQGFDRISRSLKDNYVIQSIPPEFVLSAVYEYTGKEEILSRNDSAAEEICNYFKYNKEREETIIRKINALMKGNKKIAIWGTGASAMWLLNNIPSLQERVEFYVDNNQLKIGKKIFAAPICLPDKLQEQQDVIVIICVMINANEILDQMEQLEIENEYYILGQ